MILTILGVIAIGLSSAGYIKQILHIRKHKEVRDLSLSGFVSFFSAYFILFLKAVQEESWIFGIKQLIGTILVGIIVVQIKKHQKDNWED